AIIGIEGKKRKTRSELFEDIAPRRQRLRREMVPGSRREGVRAVGAADAVRRTHHHRGAFVVGLVALHARADVGFARLPGLLELRPVALGTITGEERRILPDARGDEVLASLLEDRAALLAVGGQQGIASPALELRGELPAEVRHVLEPIVETERAVGR